MMRRTERLWLIALPTLALSASLMVLGVAAAPAEQGAAYPVPECETQLSKVAEPMQLYVGDEAIVTAVISGTCPTYDLPIDLVLLVDKSNSMTFGDPSKETGTPSAGGRERTEVPGRPSFPTTGAPGPRPTRDPGIVPRSDEPEAAIGRVRGLAQQRATRTPAPGDISPRQTPTGTPDSAGIGQPPRGQEEAPGTEDNIRAMQESVGNFLDQIQDQVKAGKIRVSLVSFDERAHSLVPLTDNVNKVRSRLNSIRGGGNTRIDLGLQAAQRELVGSNVRGRTDLDHTKTIIVWTDGLVDPRTTARLHTRENLKILAVGVGRSPVNATLRRVATENNWVFKHTEVRDLTENYGKIAPNPRAVSRISLDMVEQLAGNMELVTGSVNPAPGAMPDARTMTWHLQPPTLPFTVTYRVRPLEAGTLPLTVQSKVTYTDSEKRTLESAFPELKLEVLKAGGP
jgi:uncharacterized protein YegL